MTAHVQPASVQIAGARRLYLHDALTGRVIASRRTADWHPTENRISWICSRLEDETGERFENLGTREDDDGREWIEADGQIVAWVSVG